jgi:hypothetical protein
VPPPSTAKREREGPTAKRWEGEGSRSPKPPCQHGQISNQRPKLLTGAATFFSLPLVGRVGVGALGTGHNLRPLV